MITIVTPNRNRLSSLRTALPSWQRAESVSEIVVVDFGSEQAISGRDFPSQEKLKIVRVVNPDKWRIGLAINIGCDFASGEAILKLDSDIGVVDLSALSSADLTRSFFRGHFQTAVSNGQCLFAKPHWQAIGGYNEWLSDYGFDDTDFYQRLRRSGIIEKRIPPGLLEEIRHGDELRVGGEVRTEFVRAQLPSASHRVAFYNSRNTYLAMMRQWEPALRVPYTVDLTSGTPLVRLGDFHPSFRWADALAGFLAVARMSGEADNSSLSDSIVATYLADAGGF